MSQCFTSKEFVSILGTINCKRKALTGREMREVQGVGIANVEIITKMGKGKAVDH